MVHSKQDNDDVWLPDDDLVEALIRNSQENEIKLAQTMTERLAKPSFRPSNIPNMPKKTSEVWTLSKPEKTKKKAPVRITKALRDKQARFDKRQADGWNDLTDYEGNEIIVITEGICLFDDFLKWLDADGKSLHSRSKQFERGCGGYYNYFFDDIVMRIWWFDHETGVLTAKHLAYIVYHYLLWIKVYTSEKWKPESEWGTGENDLFSIWWNQGSKTGVILNEFSLDAFMADENNRIEQEARYEMREKMASNYWDEPITSEDFELIHEVHFDTFTPRLMRLKEAFAQVVSKWDPKSLTSLTKSISVVMEQSYASGWYDTDDTIKILDKCGWKMKSWNQEQKEDFSSFLNSFTSGLMPLDI